MFRNKKLLVLDQFSFMRGVSVVEELKLPEYLSVADGEKTYAPSMTADPTEEDKQEHEEPRQQGVVSPLDSNLNQPAAVQIGKSASIP